MMERKKVLELDKICRVCIAERKDMRPLFSEKVAEMLMECASVSVEPTEGWPDKICVQCVHAVSRCHAFKMLVERNDKELREYIKSLTVRLVIDDAQPQPPSQQQPEIKLQSNQSKILQLQQQQKQQKLLQKQLVKQQQEEKQQRLLQEKQKQQQQLLLQQQQQQNKQKRKAQSSAIRRTTQRQNKKIQMQQQQLQQQEQQQLQQQQQHHQIIQHHPQPQQTIVEPVALHAVVTNSLHRSSHVQQQQQQQQQQILPTTTALPQQIVMPNGQIITTTQIVGPPQIAQIINTTSQHTTAQPPTAVTQQFTTPQIIQTTSGQTLQLIQQPNGQHALQLVQLVPQRTATITTTTDDEVVHMTIDEDALIEQSEQHLIDDDENDDDDNEGGQEQICETIIVKEEQLQPQHLLAPSRHSHVSAVVIDEDNLSQSETQELEYLEDITVTTSSTTVNSHLHLQQQHHQQHHHHQQDDTIDHDDIIEEIHMEEEELLEDDEGGVIQVMDGNAEFISEGEDGSQQQQQHHHHLISKCDHDVDDDELQFTVMEACEDNVDCDTATADDGVDDDMDDVDGGGGGSEINEINENEMLHADSTLQNTSNPSSTSMDFTHSISASTIVCQQRQTLQMSTANSNTPKKSRKSVNSKAIANSRQLAATASSIASAGGDGDDFEIDSKFIAEFISQQATTLVSGRFVCNLCRLEFKQFKGLQNHMYLHSNWIRANCKKQPQCEICWKSFKGPGMLKMHMKTHQSAARTPTCNVCGKSFKSKAILYRHRQTHQQRAYSCGVEDCRKTFSTPSTLRSHSDRKHANSTQLKYKCGECGILFDDVDVLYEHVQMGHDGNNVRGGSNNISNNSTTTVVSTDATTGAIFVVTQA